MKFTKKCSDLITTKKLPVALDLHWIKLAGILIEFNSSILLSLPGNVTSLISLMYTDSALIPIVKYYNSLGWT